MILIVTNKDDSHVDFVLPEIEKLGEIVCRLNTEDFPKNIEVTLTPIDEQCFGAITTPAGEFNLSSIRSVWYRRPLPPDIDLGITQEQYRVFAKNEIRSVLNGIFLYLDCLWVSRPESIRLAENKIFQLRVAKSHGFNIPLTLITSNPVEAKLFCQRLKGGVVVKALSGTVIRGVDGQKELVYTHLVKGNDLAFIDTVSVCPILLQEYVSKAVELRITVIGEQVFAASINSQENEHSKVDWRKGIDSGVLRYTACNIPNSVERACINLVKSLHLQFGAIDMIKTPEDNYVFLEINPNGQWAWIELATGLPIRAALVDLLLSKNHKQ
jgi:glutathione synthase/RimK-type ligase-like ATP-grasp enzyme